LAGKISVTWGLEQLGITRDEMMLLIHLAGRHYSMETGSAQTQRQLSASVVCDRKPRLLGAPSGLPMILITP